MAGKTQIFCVLPTFFFNLLLDFLNSKTIIAPAILSYNFLIKLLNFYDGNFTLLNLIFLVSPIS